MKECSGICQEYSCDTEQRNCCTNTHKNQVQLFIEEGNFIKSVGKVMDHCEEGNNRVQVPNTDLFLPLLWKSWIEYETV